MSLLQIITTPFRPTLLSQPLSPHSPRAAHAPQLSTPLVPRPQPSQTQVPLPSSTAPLLSGPPPAPPSAWVWQCHRCGRTYALGVTRRCLVDGHVFCAGTPAEGDDDEEGEKGQGKKKGGVQERTVGGRRQQRQQKRQQQKRKKAGLAEEGCKHEFDFAGWERWNRWRAKELELRLLAARLRLARESTARLVKMIREEEIGGGCGEGGCWTQCLFPSDCLWRRILLAARAAGDNEATAGDNEGLAVDADEVKGLVGLIEDTEAGGGAETGTDEQDVGTMAGFFWTLFTEAKEFVQGIVERRNFGPVATEEQQRVPVSSINGEIEAAHRILVRMAGIFPEHASLTASLMRQLAAVAGSASSSSFTA